MHPLHHHESLPQVTKTDGASSLLLPHMYLGPRLVLHTNRRCEVQSGAEKQEEHQLQEEHNQLLRAWDRSPLLAPRSVLIRPDHAPLGVAR
jgi:hypothetical protein